MSQENVQAVQDIYDRWREGDFQTLDLFDPLALFVLGPEFPDVGAGLVFPGSQGDPPRELPGTLGGLF